MTYFRTSDDASSAFYSAFEMADMQLMDAVWAESEVSCIHPGSMPLVVRDEIISSWQQVLANLNGAVIHVDLIHQVVADNLVIELVSERFATDHHQSSARSQIIATNIYRQQSSGWRIIQHHASPARTIETIAADPERLKYLQ